MSSQTRSLPLSLRRLWIRSVVAFLLMFLLAYLESLRGNPGERFGPLVDPAFGDLLEYQPTFRLLHTAAFFSSPDVPHVAYPPFGALLFVPLYGTEHPIAVYILVAVAFLGLTLYLVRRELIRRGISPWVATLFLTCLTVSAFPVEGLLQRGNLELFVFLLSALGVWSYWCTGRSDEIAAICWGLAGAIKLYPILFLLLLLSRGRYRGLMFGVAAFVASSLLSMIYLGPNLAAAWAGSWHNVLGYQGTRVVEWSAHDLSTNHSFFILVKVSASLLRYPSGALVTIYLVSGVLLFGAIYLIRLQTMPEMNQLLVVSVFVAGFPPTSYFYTLVHLYPVFVTMIFAVLRSDRRGEYPRGLRGTIQTFVPLLASFTLFTFRGIHLYGGPVQALFLLLLLVCGLVFPFSISWPERVAGKTGCSADAALLQ